MKLSIRQSDEDAAAGLDHKRMQVARAFSIHILTASGAAWAFLALLEATRGAWAAMFFWLGVALIVDGIDGPLARRAKLSERLPRWSGETLDLVVDFVTYVFVPAYAIAMCGLLPGALGTVAGLAIVVSSALYFSDTGMKTEDNYFLGFPGIWNAVAFYLMLLSPPEWMTVAFVAALVVMTFLPIPFIHPLRVVKMRGLHFVLLLIWAVLALIAVGYDMMPAAWVKGGLSMIGLYIIGGGLAEAGRVAKPK